MTRSPVNRRDPSGTKRIEREEIARQREIIRLYGDAMARVATGDDSRRTEILERLKSELADDLSAETDQWMARTEQATVENTDRIMNNLHTGIKLGNVRIPRGEIEMLRANIQLNVRSVADDLLKDVTRITVEGYQEGLGANEITRAIVDATDAQVRHAETIVRTETMRVGDTVAKARYVASGCDGYMSYPTEDDRLCAHCIKMAVGNGGTTLKVYGLDEPMALPWHPNCRCARLPHYEGQKEVMI